MNAKAYAIALLIVIWSYVLYTGNAFGQTPTIVLSPYKDYAMTNSTPPRDAKGVIKRDAKVIREYRKLYPCPSTGLYTGACPGWSLDHPKPISCGGVDAVWNMTWMDNRIKTCSADFCKDRYERKIYGGRGMSEGCP